ncbi:hypothetical protein QE392_001393 [Microbacterium proteolyticum]|uniref:hypothetical protein n=1 Tax=Microbacterium proteolyticum TaxID=1572644 RepID=UPI00278413E9|nr:hypothetical protein [Microbacterium proteolyticum]MDQ1169589.1 hypothetical protein [Microbacterium proteolyticum]
MAVVVNKTFLQQCSLDIGADTYTSAFRDPAIVPTTVEVSVVDAAGNSVPFTGTTTYVFTASMYQDWTATGLAKAWAANEGAQATIKYKLPGVQGVFTITVVLKPVQIGGPTNAVAESPISLPVVGKPVWAAA